MLHAGSAGIVLLPALLLCFIQPSNQRRVPHRIAKCPRNRSRTQVNIEELKTFVEIVNAGGISPAAFRLGVSKSVVSRRLARLEKDLDMQLFSRPINGAVLTEAGMLFRKHAIRACAEIYLGRQVTQPTGQIRGRMRIAVPLSLGLTHFAPVLASMARLFPQLQIHSSYSDQIVDLVGEGFDCAIRLGHVHESSLIAHKIGAIPEVIVASPLYITANGSPETAEELLTHEVLMRGLECWQLLEGGKRISIRPQGRFKADNGNALVAATLAGLGVACFPLSLIRQHIESGELVPVMTRYSLPPAGVYVVRPPAQHPNRRIRILTELLFEHFNMVPLTAPVAPYRPQL